MHNGISLWKISESFGVVFHAQLYRSRPQVVTRAPDVTLGKIVYLRYNGATIEPERFLRSGGIREKEIQAARRALLAERELWLTVMQHWVEDPNVEPDERQQLIRQIQRTRRLLKMSPWSTGETPEAIARRREQTRLRVQRYRQRIRTALLPNSKCSWSRSSEPW